jgi:hypothetical protein
MHVKVIQSEQQNGLSANYSFSCSATMIISRLFEDFALIELFTIMFTFPQEVLIHQLLR